MAKGFSSCSQMAEERANTADAVKVIETRPAMDLATERHVAVATDCSRTAPGHTAAVQIVARSLAVDIAEAEVLERTADAGSCSDLHLPTQLSAQL